MRAIDYATITVSVHAGAVTLSGFAANPVSRARAEQAARKVPGVLEQVERVIINPHNRHVIACVVRGEFPDPGRSDSSLPDWSVYKRSVVIPMTAVRDITVGGVFLNINGREATRCSDFHRTAFALPAKDWRPPYPYDQAAALLDEAQYKPAQRAATELTVSGTRLNG